MAVYVDPMFPTPKGWGPGRRYLGACRLVADTATELHRFADEIGLRRSWAQGGGKSGQLVHYDLTATMRRKAVKHGARELPTRRALMPFIRRARSGARASTGHDARKSRL